MVDFPFQKQIDGKLYDYRDYLTRSYDSTHGRASVKATCPFCGAEVKLYLWSLSGCGKKCGCGAYFTRGYCRKETKNE